tara:strand:+ start:9789 stop:15815 length:6027 start_codon:yes stop_codon:yes gene_type:complete
MPIRFFDGKIVMAETDVSSNGYGFPWGHTRTYSNVPMAAANQSNGRGWIIESWPFLDQKIYSIPVPSSGSSSGGGSVDIIEETAVEVIWGSDSMMSFLEVSPAPALQYQPYLATTGYLTHDAAAKEYTLTDRAGNKSFFNDFTVADGPGRVKRLQSVGAVDVDFQYTGSRLTKIVRSAESFEYTYITSGPNDGFISSVTFSRSSTPIRKTEYEYYTDSDSFGDDGHLKTAILHQYNGSSWDELSTQYYRYYKEGAALGSEGRMQFALSPEAFQKLSATTDPFAAAPGVVAQFADFKFEYDDRGRVNKEWTRAGSMEFTYAYTLSTNEIGPNSWTYKTVMGRPDGATETVYANYAGSTMLNVLKDGGDEWCSFQSFDFENRVILQADAAAIKGYSESSPSLLGYNESDGSYTDLEATEGLIKLTSYVDGNFVFEEKIKKGQTGTEILVSRSEYLEHTPTGSTESIYLLEKSIAFPDETDPNKTIETSYAYTFHNIPQPSPLPPLEMKVASRTTTLPVIPTDQNGSGVANSFSETIDLYNNTTEVTNEEGIKTSWTFDIPTGSVKQQIADVGSSPHFNLTTDYTLDNLGRTTQQLGPAHDIDISGTMTEIRTATWTVYDDPGHQLRVGMGYQQTGSGTDTLINPVSITQFDKNGNILESIQAARASTSGKLLPTDTFAQPEYTRWTTRQYTECCMAASERVYHNIPASGTGSSGANYDQTNFGYDVMDRRNRVVTPGGTITATVFDVRSLPEEVYVGTNDDGGTENDPTGGGSDPNNNMVVITTNEYDDGSDGGNGNLTKQTSHVDSNSSNDRIVKYEYDFRNRLDKTETTDGITTWFDVPTYDNLNRVTAGHRYHTSVAAGNLIALQESEYDDLSRVFKTINYGVNPSNGVINPNSQVSQFWFSQTGRPMKDAPSGSELFSKTQYDNLGRVEKQFVGYGPGATYADAESVSNDTILEQREAAYDDSSFVARITSYQRNHNGTGTGVLTTSNARVTYSYAWQDGIGRSIAIADYGTASPGTRGAIPPSSQTVLVTTTEYNADTGNIETRTDPADTATRLEYDDAGRQVKLIQNYIDGSTANDANITTEKTYNTDGNVSVLTAWNADTGNQVTTYEYGTTLSDSEVATSLLKRRVKYPDSIDNSDSVTVKYDRQAAQITVTDQRGTVHAYAYDNLGRLTTDAVTNSGIDVDDSVLKLTLDYDIRGLRERATSYDNAVNGTATNQVRWSYNDFGQLTTSYQEHAGTVTPGVTPKVDYSYADGSANTLRSTALTYPDGRELTYDFGTAGGTDDKASRVAGLKDGTTTLARYTYLGFGSVVEVEYTEPGMLYDLIGGSSGYSGLDQFNRIVDSLWKKSSTAIDRVQYGYDRVSNRTYREVPTDTTNRFDELYSHDGVHRLDDLKRGQLNGSHTGMSSTEFQQAWTLDETGNWSIFKQDDNGNGTWNLDQNRTSNKVNEITNLDNTVGSQWGTPQYDKVGNMARIPNPESTFFGWNEMTVDNWYDLTVDEWYNLPVTKDDTAVYDAWNRLVRIEREGETLQIAEYDALRRRITVESYTAGVLDETRHSYFTSAWQAIEERVDLGTTAERQNIWGIRYIDDLVLRDRDTNDDGILEERLYSLQDANWNVTSVCDASGIIQERYAYHAYGRPLFLDPAYGGKSSSSHDWTTLFTGYQWDSNPSLYCVRNRSYSPVLGAWLQRDPVGYLGRDPNLQRYNISNPIDFVDPSGLWREGGHFYTVYNMARLAGMSHEDARQLAYFAQYNDEVRAYDAVWVAFPHTPWEGNSAADEIGTTRSRLARQNWEEAVQRVLHQLHGGDIFEIARNREHLRGLFGQATNDNDVRLAGITLHAFGDSFAHTYRDKNGRCRAFDSGIGHARGRGPLTGKKEGGTAVDKIRERYIDGVYPHYVESLANLLGISDNDPRIADFLNRMRPTIGTDSIVRTQDGHSYTDSAEDTLLQSFPVSNQQINGMPDTYFSNEAAKPPSERYFPENGLNTGLGGITYDDMRLFIELMRL